MDKKIHIQIALTWLDQLSKEKGIPLNDFSVFVGTNHCKISVYWDKKEILFDKQFQPEIKIICAFVAEHNFSK